MNLKRIVYSKGDLEEEKKKLKTYAQ